MDSTNTFPLTWELDSLLPHPETVEFRKIFDQFETELKSLADESESLPAVDTEAANVTGWCEFLKQYESISSRATDLNAFIGCHAAADAQNKLFQSLEAQLSALDPLRERIDTNFQFALQEVSSDGFSEFIAVDAYLQSIQFFLEQSRKQAELRLPKEQEVLAAELAVDSIHAWGRLYDRLSGELRISVMEKGAIVEKSPGQVQFDSASRAVRENNFYAADKAWGTIAETCADALNHISGTRLTVYRQLGLEDHLVVPLNMNRLKRESLSAMWSAVTNRKPMLLKYLEAKAKLLGLKKLAWYDLQAPLPSGLGQFSQAELSYDDACHLVIDTFTAFSPEKGAFARKALDDRWIEVENRDGKRQGGFCTGFPTTQQSRIFMTYTNSPDSMSTLAHELGHAYHSHVLRDQPLFLQDYPMNLAETASTFAEAVLGDKRLENADTDLEQLTILDNMLSDSVSFLMNIHARFLFEDQFHQERVNGELSAERLSELMLGAQQEAYLDALDSEGWNSNFWISKLHFYISGWPFYNFPYTFGYLLSLGLSSISKDAEGDFPEQYRKLLIATGCQETEQAVEDSIGYDLTEETFWNRSLDVVEQRVERFLELAKAY